MAYEDDYLVSSILENKGTYDKIERALLDFGDDFEKAGDSNAEDLSHAMAKGVGKALNTLLDDTLLAFSEELRPYDRYWNKVVKGLENAQRAIDDIKDNT